MTPACTFAAPRAAALGVLLALSAAPAGRAERPQDAARPDEHVMDVRLDPATGRLEGTDRLTTDGRSRIRMGLRPDLEAQVTCGGRPLRVRRAADGTLDVRVPRACREGDRMTLDVAWSGVVADPVEEETSLHFVTGDRTSGLIAPQGAFLSGSGWHPDTGALATFDLTARVPEGWSVVSQGRRADDPAPGAFRYVAESPTDGLSLSAGPYEVTTRQHGDVTLGVWLLPGGRVDPEPFLDAAAREIDRLEALVGPYPFAKFDVVENFFTTGYGFPSYTLLGQEVLAMGPRALRPGYLDHEIAHVWFGNHVLVDPDGGNWCEGLVTYLTNYLNTAREGEEAAFAHRRRVSQRYAVDVPAGADMAPADWREKSDDAGASIGYGKVSMAFHALARHVGEDAFAAGLRDVVARLGGRRASWSDLQESFERASGADLDEFFAHWVGRPGLPRLRLEGVEQDGAVVRGDVVQDGEPWSLDLELELEGLDGARLVRPIRVEGERTSFAVAAEGRVAVVRLDPAFHVARQLGPEELPSSLARTLASSPLIVTPAEPRADDYSNLAARRRFLREIGASLADRGEVMEVQHVAEADVTQRSVVLLGSSDDNAQVGRFAEALLAAGVDVSQPTSFRAGDRRWTSHEQALLASAPHPDLPGASVTILAPIGPKSVENTRAPFFYGWDGWVVLERGRAVDRGTVWPESPRTTARLARPGDDPGTRMMQLVRALVDPALEGRESGTPATAARVRMLEDALREAGVAPVLGRGYADAFAFMAFDVDRRAVLNYAEPGFTGLPVVPAHDTIPVPDTLAGMEGLSFLVSRRVRAPWVVPFPRGAVFAGDVTRPRFEGLDLEGSLAVLRDDAVDEPPPQEQARRVDRWLTEARLRNAAGLLIVRPNAERPAWSALTVLASMGEEPWKARAAANGGHRGVERAAAGRRAAGPGLQRRDLPVVFGGRDVLDALAREGGLSIGARSWEGRSLDVRYNAIVERIEDANLLGRIEGQPPAHPEIMLSAHHDGIGADAEGRFTQGAVDNAAGVAVVLEVARRLVVEPPARDVIIALTGAEEWGLHGSRRLAAEWPEPPPGVVLNVDSVGVRDAPLVVIGRSREPELAKLVDGHAAIHGFVTGSDVDRHGDANGSDHWPWVARDTEAVTIFQAEYARINGASDVVERVDPATLVRLADALEGVVRALAQ